MAARCVLMRKYWFSEFLKVYETKHSATDVAVSSPPGFAPQLVENLKFEKMVAYHALAIDLFSRAYEQFKRWKNNRIMLFVAGEIANIYRTSGRHEMALK